MRLLLLTAAAGALVSASVANAQEYRFPAIRGDVQVGADRFYSEGNNNTEIGVGGSAGVDFLVGTNFVLGAEGTFWWAPNENITRDGPGVAARKSFEEWAGALRAGVLVDPATLVYGKVGLAVNEQRKRFNADPVVTPGFPGGNPLFGDYYNTYRTRGWVVGGGIERLLSDNLYVKAEGRYSNYRTNSSRLTGVLGLGLRFGPSAEAPEPVVAEPAPPPPPPPAPATQTCPDGSVILATDACPVPPPPPPPPPPAPERG